MTFVLFYGSFNSYDQVKEFWLPKLISLKQKIIFPRFPMDTWDEVTALPKGALPKKQSLQSWLKVFEEYVDEIKKEKDLIFVGHSTGPLFILHVLQKFRIQLNSAIFVSPFLNPLANPAWQVKLVNASYFSNDFNFRVMRKLCPFSYVAYGTDDPYVETENSLNFAREMGSTVIPVEGGGHLNNEESSEAVISLCKSRVTMKS